jgi:hypothetical protein
MFRFPRLGLQSGMEGHGRRARATRSPSVCCIRCRAGGNGTHVSAHELGAAAYAIKAVRVATPGCEEQAGRLECQWQREQLPDAIRELVLDDQLFRNDICWSVFDC